jgi:hypothetical protein
MAQVFGTRNLEQLTSGSWHLAPGIWLLAAGIWHLASGIWHLASGRHRIINEIFTQHPIDSCLKLGESHCQEA